MDINQISSLENNYEELRKLSNQAEKSLSAGDINFIDLAVSSWFDLIFLGIIKSNQTQKIK